MSLIFSLLDRFNAFAQKQGLPLEPMDWFEIEFRDGGSRTVLGLEVRGTCFGERLWLRTLEHGSSSPYSQDADGFWLPPSGIEQCLRPARWHDGPRMMLVNPTEGHLQAVRQDLEATLEWALAHRALQTRLTTLASMERATEELENLGAHFGIHRPADGSQRPLQAEQRLLTLLRTRLAKRIEERRDEASDWSPSDYQARLEQEWNRLQAEELLPVLYVLHDVSAQAQRNGIRIGAVEGSLPGLLVAHLLRLTTLDPVAHSLPFEPWFSSWNGDPRIAIHAESEHAEALQHWAKPRAQRHSFQVEVKPSRPLSILATAFRNSGFTRPPREAWQPFDPKVFESLQRGELEKFGLDPDGLESNLVPIHPTEFSHLMAWTVLGRCWGLGREGLITYVDRRFGRGIGDTAGLPTLPLLEETYGLLLYQEQASALIVRLSGCGDEAGEQLRKELVSGNPSRLQMTRNHIRELALSNGTSSEEVNTVLDQIQQEGPRTFSKCHAASQASLVYELAWWMTYASCVLST